MRVVSWNVNGIRAREAQVALYIEQEQPDILCLQEIKAPPEKVPASLRELDGYWCYWHGTSGYSGVGLLVRKASFERAPEFSHPSFDYESRIVAARIGNLLAVSVYVPNGGKEFEPKMQFMEALAAFVATERHGNLVVCGDINVAHTDRDVHPKERKLGIIGQRPDERALVSQILESGLVDIARQLHPDDSELFTWWAPWRNMRERNIGWRIDYILASSALAARASSFTVAREFGSSDHAPLSAVFNP